MAGGLGVALLPEAESPAPNVVVVPLTGQRGRDVALVTGRYRPTAAVARFNAFIANSGFPNGRRPCPTDAR